MKKSVLIVACVAAFVVAAAAQGMGQGAPGAAAAPASLVAEVQRQFTTVSTNVIRLAEQFPEDKYTWAPPVPTQPDGAAIRTWAQLVAHMTDDANNQCWGMSAQAGTAPTSVERGQPAPNSKSKADLVAGITAAMGTCTKAFANVTPANMMEPSGGRGNASKIGQLVTYVAHANEHYGNMVTYQRMAGLVPPSSAPRAGGGGARPGGAPQGGGRQ